jgi:UDP-glucose 4-epimerase
VSERVLVTGGAGFIGSHLCEEWLQRGAAVVALDDLSSGRIENLRRVFGQRGFEFVRGSAADPVLLEELVSGATRIAHLAASVGVRGVCERPRDVLSRDLCATTQVEAAALRASCPVLYTSSSEVYGPLAEPPLSEERSAVLVSDPVRGAYAASKAAGEALFLAAHRQYELPVVVARLFNVLGPRQRLGHVVPAFVRAAIGGEPLRVHGSGAQTRSFAHVRDVARALADLALEPRAIGRVVNVGSLAEISIADLARRCCALAGAAEQLEHIPLAEAYGARFLETQRRSPDLARLEQLIGWTPPAHLDEWLTELVDDERARRS